MGVKSKTIHSLSQALGTGVVFLELQLKEYTAAFLTFRDSIFGSDFYGTTCLHGLHVTTGSTSFGILWCSLNNNEGYKEVHQYQKSWGYYWHLVDSIWISLFMLFYLRIIFKVVVHGFLRLRYIGSPIPRHQTNLHVPFIIEEYLIIIYQGVSWNQWPHWSVTLSLSCST